MPLAAPTGLSLTGKIGRVDLLWTSVAGATGYNIYRRVDGADAGTDFWVGTTATTSHTDQPVSNVVMSDGSFDAYTWRYTVKAFDSGGEGTGAEDTVLMPDVSDSDVTSSGILHPIWDDGAGGSTEGYSDVSKTSSETSDSSTKHSIAALNYANYAPPHQ